MPTAEDERAGTVEATDKLDCVSAALPLLRRGPQTPRTAVIALPALPPRWPATASAGPSRRGRQLGTFRTPSSKYDPQSWGSAATKKSLSRRPRTTPIHPVAIAFSRSTNSSSGRTTEHETPPIAPSVEVGGVQVLEVRSGPFWCPRKVDDERVVPTEELVDLGDLGLLNCSQTPVPLHNRLS